MRLYILTFFLLLTSVALKANEPDSAYVFSYTCGKNNNTAGLNLAWSVDRENWHAIGPEFRFLASDFGTWGGQKKMFDPFLFQDNDGLWHCLWTLNVDVHQFAHAASADLYNWKRQSYPEVVEAGNVANIEVSFDKQNNVYTITWINEINGAEKIFKTTTNDFKTYSEPEEASEAARMNLRETVRIDGEEKTGVINKLSWKEIDALIKWNEWSRFHEQQRADNTSLDAERFKDMKTLEAEISVLPEKSKAISDMLIGIFFEDINFAADGGLYAELVKNRSFKFDDPMMGWKTFHKDSILIFFIFFILVISTSERRRNPLNAFL